ncbi:spore germination protein [Paenibacillus sp. OAS669]|uniref:spore germination protein n=1 Tax=Paenibacillus sp. OAS669 TaxID=2663821 RepID=UPI00178B6FDE|nr:spore germination protein [Paenibacillus sp. OAS669]MBE1447389.1 spore germination protein KA/spore germination protein [Paenibacillus sp. OAS669]
MLGSRSKTKKADKTQGQKQQNFDYQFIDELKSVPVFLSLEENKAFLNHLFDDCSDFVIREFDIEHSAKALLFFIDGMVNTEFANDAMKALMILEGEERQIDRIIETTLPVTQVQKSCEYKTLLTSVLGGDAGLIVDGNKEALMMGIRGMEKRSIQEPETESVIRGPREGFVENLRTNTSMVRRKLKTPRLKMKPMTLGRESNTSIVITYMEDLADPNLVDEVLARLEKIDIDAVLETGYLEEFIQDSAYSPFPQVQYTERPDMVASALLQGRIGIIVDGTPFVLLVPFVFSEALHATEDYYERFQIMTLIRWLRYSLLILSLLTPGLYVAFTTFHQDLLPTSLLMSVAASREAIPFPAVVEAFIMEAVFEALREAGIRLPKTIGSAVSILGALVIGQAAVQAGIVSAPMVIVVSLTGIASFTIPRFNAAIAIRILRFPIMFAAATFGLFGILVCVMLILGHMANLRTFGIPYLSPYGPLSSNDLKDNMIRAPWWAMKNRPAFLSVKDSIRQGDDAANEIKEQGGQRGMSIEHKDKNKGDVQ